MPKLSFIRHGQSEMNVRGIYAGLTNTPLTNEGRAQAKRAGKQAKQMDIDLIICSPLSRAHETAKIIAREIGYPEDKIEIHPELIERNFGALEGTSHESAGDISEIGITLDIEGIEQTDELIARGKRVVDYVDNHSANAKHILLVGHGSIGRAIRYHVNKETEYKQKIPNAELVQWL